MAHEIDFFKEIIGGQSIIELKARSEVLTYDYETLCDMDMESYLE